MPKQFRFKEQRTRYTTTPQLHQKAWVCLLLLFCAVGCLRSPSKSDSEPPTALPRTAKTRVNLSKQTKMKGGVHRNLPSSPTPETVQRPVTSADSPILPSPQIDSPAVLSPEASRRARVVRRLRRVMMESGAVAGPHPARVGRTLLDEKPADQGSQGGPRGYAARSQGWKEGTADGKSKSEKKNTGTKQAQVWQRTADNTVLSRVSVGGSNYLVLKKMRVTVYVQGLRARTVIDHIYYNPHDRTLQGTFKYTLPAEASISYYAMFVGQQQRRSPRFFVGKGPTPQQLAMMQPQQIASMSPSQDWGQLREARLVPAEKGREVYEEITRQRIDPALLEQDAPNTFQGRVFPIPARGHNRVILAYEQTLPLWNGDQIYRFRFPREVAESIDFSLEYNDALSSLQRSNLQKILCRTKPKRSFLRCYWEQGKPDRDAVFYFKPKRPDVSWVTGADPVDQKQYLYARMNVNFPVTGQSYAASQAVFLLDTSLSANPDTFAAHVELLRQILVRNESTLQRFNVILFDVGSQWASSEGWIKNNAAERKRLLSRINSIVLEGATDLDTAFKTLARPVWDVGKHDAVDIFLLSDGQLNWGETQFDAILRVFRQRSVWSHPRFFTYQLGIGAENLELLRRLAREGGAVFTCLGREALPDCATAHTKPAMFLEQVKIDGIQSSDILVAGRQTSIFPGGQIALAARYAKTGTATLSLRGRVQGKSVTLTYSIPVKTQGDLAPRAWAELAVQQLIELDDPKLTDLIVAYSQHFRIPNKHCSFLVLETDAEYKQYGLDQWKKTEKVSDVAVFIEEWMQKRGMNRTLRERWLAILRKGMMRSNMLQQSSGRAVFSLLQHLAEQEFALGDVASARVWTNRDVPAAYLRTRLQDHNVFDAFTPSSAPLITEFPIFSRIVFS